MVPARLRAALAAKDLSVSAAARILGWKQPNFHRQTKGQVSLSVVQMEWIEERLGIPMSYLLGYTELPTFSRRLRSVPNSDPATPLFNDGTGDHRATGSESFLGESNSRPFHYKGNGQVIHLPFRPETAPADCPMGQAAKVIPFRAPLKVS